MAISRVRLIASASLAATLLLSNAAIAAAHVLKDFGTYSVALGWAKEPTYVGQINAVQVVIKDKAGKAVTDLADGDLKVVVSIGGQDSSALALVNTFDEDTGLGIPGDYEAPLTPTTAGDYTFHLTGSIHDQAVDETATSSDSTFDSAVEATDIQFPNKLPSLTEITTSLDRINSRLASLVAPSAAPLAPSAAPPAPAPTADAGLTDAVTAAQSAASQAHDAATTAMLVALIAGAIGLVLGGGALLLVLRRPRGA